MISDAAAPLRNGGRVVEAGTGRSPGSCRSRVFMIGNKRRGSRSWSINGQEVMLVLMGRERETEEKVMLRGQYRERKSDVRHISLPEIYGTKLKRMITQSLIQPIIVLLFLSSAVQI